MKYINEIYSHAKELLEKGFRKNKQGLTIRDFSTLEYFFYAPNNTLTPDELCVLLDKNPGQDARVVASGAVGGLGKRVIQDKPNLYEALDEILGITSTDQKIFALFHWVLTDSGKEGWQLRKEWIDALHPYYLDDTEIKEEIDEAQKLDLPNEGRVFIRISKVIERNPVLRQQCLDLQGYNCLSCNISIKQAYGIDKDVIEVHHTNPLATGVRHSKAEDLIPLCPNCHSVVHSRWPIYSLEELKSMIPSQ